MNPTQDIIPILKLALRYHREGNLDYAKYVYQHVLGIDPQNADALHLLGVSVYQSEQYDIAINLITQAIQIDSTKPLFFTNLGNAFQKQGKLEQSTQAYQKAIQIQPDYAEAYFNLGNSLREQGKLKESTQALQKAVQIQPDYADAHFNLAMLLLLQGQFVEGWEKYEWRWDSSLKSQKRNFKRPLWDGTSLSSKSILIYAEQGFGDSIQFVRYIDLFPDTTTIIVACQPELKSLLKRIGRIDTLVTKGEDIPKFDFHAPIVSLPHIFGTVLETIPAKIPYLYPDKNSDFAFLSNDERDLKVGIAWAGSPTHINDRNRSISLNNFKCLLDIKGCEFFSLQVGEHHRDIKRCGYSRIIKDLGKQFTNFHHTASAILQLDLVISVDTAVAHLAGALGKPVWTLLPFIPDWRWMLNRSDSPWYPCYDTLSPKEERRLAQRFPRNPTYTYTVFSAIGVKFQHSFKCYANFNPY